MNPTTKAAPVPLDDRLDWSALGTLFTLTLRQHLRGFRLVLICLLFALPTLVVVLIRLSDPVPPRASELEIGMVLTLLPMALVPLAALLYASGMIRDEVEEQTLTYLLVRPLPRRALYVTKLLATYVLVAALAGSFAVLTMIAVHWGKPGFWGEIVPVRALQVALLVALALVAYCSIFGLISLYTRWSLVAGIFYILLFEATLGNLEFAVRKLTVLYYFRVLAVRWLDLRRGTWLIDLADAPEAVTCVLVLLSVGVLTTLLASVGFSNREFPVKTPEGG